MMMTQMTTFVATGLAAVLMTASAQAQTDDRAAQNRATVRQMFPIVRLLDNGKKTSVASSAGTATKAATDPSLAVPPAGQMLSSNMATPALAAEIGVTAAAPVLVKGSVATFDIAGFKLGMTEDEVAAVARQHGLVLRNKTRLVDFETQVRSAAQLAYGAKYQPETGKSALGQAIFIAPDGGRYFINLLIWPDGGHVYDVTYTSPARMSPTAWRDMLTAKYGPASEASAIKNLSLNWCGARASCIGAPPSPRMMASASEDGGTIELMAAEGLRQRVQTLLDQEARRRAPVVKPSF
jgi:hypothetical protein